MVNLEFKIYDKNNDLDFFNKILIKASQDRYELRKAVNGIYYLYDYIRKELLCQYYIHKINWYYKLTGNKK